MDSISGNQLMNAPTGSELDAIFAEECGDDTDDESGTPDTEHSKAA